MSPGVFLEMIFASEALITQPTGEWSLTSVDSLVPGELLVAREGFLTVGLIALEWPLARMDPDVTPILACITQRNPAIGALVLFRPWLFRCNDGLTVVVVADAAATAVAAAAIVAADCVGRYCVRASGAVACFGISQTDAAQIYGYILDVLA